MVLIGMLTPVDGQVVPEPITTLSYLRKAVLKDEAAGTVPTRPWSRSADSWSTVWGQSAFGVGQVEAVDTSAFGFRVPPDCHLRSYGGASPFLVEAYRDGFPTWGIRRDEEGNLCRPLGFVYGADGLCRNATVYEFRKGSWTKLPRTARTKTLLARSLNYDAPAKLSDYGAPWFKIVAEGYGTYWVDHSLVAVGPYGTCCRLQLAMRQSVQEMLSGEWDGTKGPIR